MLFNVMKAYAVSDPEVGYCQGSAFIAGMLLLHMPEEDAFSVLVKLLSKGTGYVNFEKHRKFFWERDLRISSLCRRLFLKLIKIFKIWSSWYVQTRDGRVANFVVSARSADSGTREWTSQPLQSARIFNCNFCFKMVSHSFLFSFSKGKFFENEFDFLKILFSH